MSKKSLKITVNDRPEDGSLSRRALLLAGAGLGAAAALSTVTGMNPSPAFAASMPSGGAALPPQYYGPNDPLYPFYQDRALYRTQKVVIGTFGDSITEAQHASTIQKGYPARTRGLMREKYPSGALGGIDYVAARHQTAITLPGTINEGLVFTSPPALGSMRGLGRRNTPLAANVSPGVITARFSSVKLAWYAPTAGCSIDVQIGANGPWQTVTADMPGERTWNSGPVSSANHQMTIKRKTGDAQIEGMWFFDGDEDKGIHVVEGANSGSSIWQFSNGSGVSGSNSTWADSVDRFKFSLITAAWGTNDCQTRKPTEAAADAMAFANLIRTKTDSPLLFTPVFERPSMPIAGTTWEQYTDALKEAVAKSTFDNVDVFDFGDYIPKLAGVGGSDPYGWLAPRQTIHPGDSGYLRMAEVLTSKLTATYRA